MNELLQDLNAWAEVWAAGLWRASWQGAIAIAIVWSVARWCKFVSPRIVCWLWRLACLKILVALMWAQPVALRVLPAVPAAVPLPAASLPITETAETSRAEDVVKPFHASPPAVLEPSGIRLIGPLLLLWLAGVVFSAICIARQWRSVRRLMATALPNVGDSLSNACREEAERLGVRRPPRLLLSPRVESPLLTGIWRPTIVLPAGIDAFDPREVRLMLAHELAHQRRRDLLWNWLPTVVRALFFFHPLVWLMVRGWSEAQEAACDELLIQGRFVPLAEYARLLLKLAAREPLPAQPALAAAGVLGAYHNLERRILAMSLVRTYSRRRLALAVGALGLIAASSVVPWRLAPVAAATAASDEKPAGTQRNRMSGKIYVWAVVETVAPETYQGMMAVAPSTGEWEPVGPLSQFTRLSPDAKTVAFTNPPANPALLVANMKNPQPLELLADATPNAWSPDGRKLVYHTARKNDQDRWLYESWTIELATNERRKLPIPATDTVGDWSSRGDWLVTVSSREPDSGDTQLYIMHPDGSGKRRLTNGSGLRLDARFRPDGKQIAYTHATGDAVTIRVVNMDAPEKERVVVQGYKALGMTGLCWSPDGAWLAVRAFDAPEAINWRVELIAVESGERRILPLKNVKGTKFVGIPEWR